MSASHLIKDIDSLNETISEHAKDVANETKDVAERWDRLGKFGGQREDHAADLLANLIGPLQRLNLYAQRCIEHIQQLQSDPFGDKKAKEMA